MSLAKQARAVERDVFGALIGMLVAVVICRLVVLVVDINLFVLMAAVIVGAWSGAFIVHFGTNQSETAMASMKSLSDWYRAVYLRTMLWSLGAAAVLGVLAVLTGSYDVVGRVAATVAVTALAVGFLRPFLALLDERKNWRVGFLGVASVMAAYLLGTPSIWDLGYRAEETALSALAVVLMMPVGLIAMRVTYIRFARFAGVVGSLLYACVLSLFLFAIWEPGSSSGGDVARTGSALLVFGSLAVVSLVGAGTGDRRHWRWIGVSAAIVSAAMCIALIWAGVGINEKFIIAMTSVAVVVGHANLSLYAPLQGFQRWWRTGTIAAVIVCAVAFDLELLFKASRSSGISILGRVALASGILASAGTLGMMILARLNGNVDLSEVAGRISAIVLQCPRCAKRQTIPLGLVACAKCGLRIRIEIEEIESEANEFAERNRGASEH